MNCKLCGAAIKDKKVHDAFHVTLNAIIAAIEDIVGFIDGPTDD